MASVTRVNQAGHMVVAGFSNSCQYKLTLASVKVVQEQPELLAQAICDILSTIEVGCLSGRSKL